MIRRIHYIFAFLLCLTVLICLVPAAYADGLSDLQAAIGRGDETFILSTDTLIPADANIDAGDTALIVPANTTLTVKGFLRILELEIQQGGAVIVDGGHLDCPWGLTPDGTLSIINDWVDTSLFSKDEIYAAVQAGRVSYSGNAGITLHWFVTDAEYLLQALDMAAEAMSVHDHTHTRASIELDGEMQIDTDGAALSVADGVTFQLNGVQPDNGRRELSIGDLNIQSGGSVVIEDNALLEVKGHLTLNGQLTIGEGSELYITDQDEALVSSSNIRKGNSSHIVVHYYPDNKDELYTMFVSAEALPAYAHGNIHVLFDWESTYSISSGKTDFHFHAPVTTIPGSSFSLDNLYVDGPLTVAGTLSVGNLHAWSGSELVFTGTSRVTVSESFDLQGTLWVPDSINLSDLCLDPGKLAVLSQYNEGYLYVSKDAGSELRDAFLAACDQGYAEPATFVIPEGNIINLLNTSVIIPGNLTVFAIGSGIRLIGESFGVGGELICSNFIMSDDSSLWIGEGGSMYVERNFQLGSNCSLNLDGELSVEHDAFDRNTLVYGQNFFPGENSLLDVSFNMPNEQAVLAELGAPVQPFGNFRRSIWVHFPWELTGDVTVPAQVRLCVPHDGNYRGSLTIPEGKTLTINEGGEMLARGSVNGEAVIQVNGSLVNNGSINLGDPGREADIALGVSGSYSGSGSITRAGLPYDLAGEQTAYTELVAACAQEYSEPTNYDIEGVHHFIIPAGEGLFIPENLSVRALDSGFTVANSASLIIRGGGELIAGSLESWGSTEVDGSLHLEYSCRIPGDPVEVNGEIVMTLDAWVGLMESVDSFDPEDAAAKFSFGSGGLLDIWYDATDPQNVADSLDFPMFHIPHVRETLCLTFPWTLDDDRTLDEDRRLLLHCGGEYNGMLIIPEGKTLMIPQGSELFARGAGENGEAIVKIAGLLINNGVFTLQYTRAGLADAELIDGGIYAGRGTVTRGGEPYTILNDPENAQIVLPADLRMLESEALAGGDFFSVYIPAGTESIAADAFGNKDALMVFGVPDSEADIFAGDHHYLFAPTA